MTKALTDLIKNFKVIILIRDQSNLRRRAIIKELNQAAVPFDAVYRVMGHITDNYFTYESIKQDFNCDRHQVLFLTATSLPFQFVYGNIQK